MNLTLILQTCGSIFAVVLATLSFVLTAVAIFLVAKVKRDTLLTAFLPVTTLPVAAGLLVTFLGLVSAIEMQLSQTEVALEPGFVLLLNLVPLIASIVASLPAALVVVLGRWALAWQASGVRVFPERQVTIEEPDAEETQDELRRETNDYLQQLVRNR